MTSFSCFTTAPGDMFWAFIIPGWILIFIAGLQSQLSCLACDKTTSAQDQYQCFWAKKSAKSLLMFALLLYTLWLLVLSAGNEQVHGLNAFPDRILLHSIIFHQTCEKWSGKSAFGAFYRLCPKKTDPEQKTKKDEDDDDDLLTPRTPGPKNEEAAPVPNKQQPPTEAEPPIVPDIKDQPVHTESSHFYSWLTAFDNKARRASDILFRPKLA
ncbi:hypothetical protein GCK32_006381 [Trichostrongylus colubriformis]|uniref:Uncharacterized protein n=1 Tax=Trichostrongylus colubriformis TaxID=6319 RepID=A0AAN8FU45_TRICO